MPDPAMPPASARARHSSTSVLVALAAATAGVLGISALWTVWNVQTGQINGWGALVAAVDAALLLRLAGMAPGRARAALGVAATALTVLLVCFLTAATRMGMAMGLRPLESAERMGLGLAWTLTQSVAGTLDAMLIAVALPLAWWLSR